MNMAKACLDPVWHLAIAGKFRAHSNQEFGSEKIDVRQICLLLSRLLTLTLLGFTTESRFRGRGHSQTERLIAPH